MKLPFDARYLPAALLFLLALVLLYVIGEQTGWGQRVTLATPRANLQQAKMALALLQPEFALPPLEQTYTETVGRPLFVPTRRPPPPPPPPQPVLPTMRKGQFMLVGVILTKEKDVALLREMANGKISRVEKGKEINGMRLEKLEPEKATLTQWGDREELVLKIQAVPKVQAPLQQIPQTGIPGVAPAFGPSVQPFPAQTAAPAEAPISAQELMARRRASHGIVP